MRNLGRRDFLKLAGGVSAAVASGVLAVPVLRQYNQSRTRKVDFPEKAAGRVDYTRAKATPTICFGCTTHCGVIGWVQDGQVRRIEGNPLDPNSRGKICSKSNGMISYTYYPERLLYPLRRVGPRGSGRFKRIGWDEAIDEIGGRMRELREADTPERFVFHYGRDKTKGFTSRFVDAFGSPNRVNRRSICSSNRRVPLMSLYGRDFDWESQDFENTQYIVNFGGNPMEAYQGGMFIMQRIQNARVNHGAHMVTFEVRPSNTASVSDEYHPVNPGTDGAIAMAMANVIVSEGKVDEAFWERWANYSLEYLADHLKPYTPEFAAEESGVPAETIRRIALDYAANAPHCTTLSNRGSAKHYNGVPADRAIRLLDVLVGNVGRPGGFCLSSRRMWKGHYGQEGLPRIEQPDPQPPKPKPFLPGTRQFEELPEHVKERVRSFPESWQHKYYGELDTASEYPLAWLWYQMRVGQLIYPYIREGRAKVGVYMSYCLGAAYGYPEAKEARSVLKDESLIPFHVAIDINFSEHSALADIILPETTSLERWDAHGQNCHELRPYTGIRQPLVDPPGEARSLQIILRDLARRIGGGMEKYFDFEDVEEHYRAWYRNLPVSWETFKRHGIWTDPGRPKDYELYERPVPEDELDGAEIDPESGVIRRPSENGEGEAVGIMMDGKPVRGFPTPSRKIEVYDPIFPQAARLTGLAPTDVNASPLATYDRIPSFEAMNEDELVFTTFKWNVHTQGRTGHLKYQAEIVHTNPLYIHPDTAARFELTDGDRVEVTVMRPRGAVYRAGESQPVGRFTNAVRLLRGVSPGLIAASHHMGHWEYGPVAHDTQGTIDGAPGFDAASRADPDIPEHVWWQKSRGGPGNGVYINDAMPICPTPLVGGQAWFDNVCRIRKL